jgi:hypothetical protein
MSANAKQKLFPVGRMVQGSLYEKQTKDMQGNPLTIKSGPNKGQSTQRYFFAVAYPKTPGVTHWGLEPWGTDILAFGRAMWPAGQAETAKFAWKVTDGDSTEFNEGTPPRRHCDHEGFPGHWVVKFNSQYAPKVYNASGDPILEPEAVKRGYFIEVMGSIDTNENAQKPGIYINHSMVALRGFGEEIKSGPDPKAVGFGKSALPPGASATPVGTAAFPASAAPTAAGAPPAPGAPPPLPPAASAAPPAAPAPTSVALAPGFMAPPPPGAAPLPPSAAPAPPPPPAAVPAPQGPQMTALATGVTYEAFLAKGWTPEAMRAGGYLL